ncbi:tRNA (adenosine(37)-N6)-dimethylallyltransferase MiaA [Gymnodinialimonas hymeniacidonis]|uniref:tRNA (adenosine(37)-N6)-dimethylallyltransferase MiaA n=1 Tax=Gymnodinialimonas hymeniacidonis TaxID=3126508 RepID=UPI0034C6D85E
MIDIDIIPKDRPVLIAGPTASGKTALAIAIAQAQNRPIVNADSLQVYDGWRILTARPSPAEEAAAPHHLFGHVPFEAEYSVGQWLRDVTPFLSLRPIIVGGTGLYFRALTEGLVEIPATAPEVRATADALATEILLNELDNEDPVLANRIDRQNRARIQRGWEVLRGTGKPLSAWQSETPPPVLPLANTYSILLDADRDWLAGRIARRFDLMLDKGALEEARGNLARWPNAGGSAKAIGAPELIAHLQGKMTLEAARDAAIIASRQYAKRQRTWFRSNMADWTHLSLP